MKKTLVILIVFISQVACNSGVVKEKLSCSFYLHKVELVKNQIDNNDPGCVSAEYFLSVCNCDSIFVEEIEEGVSAIGSRRVHGFYSQPTTNFNDAGTCDENQRVTFSLYSVFKDSIDSVSAIKLIEQDVDNSDLSLKFKNEEIEINLESYKGAAFLPPYTKRY